jgi:hypothetical protein
VENLWNTANRVAHERLLAVLNDSGSSNLSTADGEVTLDLSVLLTQLTTGSGSAATSSRNCPGRRAADDPRVRPALDRAGRDHPGQAPARRPHAAGAAALRARRLPRGPRRREALRSVGFGFLTAGVLALL